MFKAKKIICFVGFFCAIFCSFVSADYTAEYLKKEYGNRIANFLNRYYVNRNYIPEISVVNIYDEPVKRTKIEISLYFDETQFSDGDLDFIKSVIISQIGLDLTKGNTITLYKIPFKKDVFSLDVIKQSLTNNKFIKPLTNSFNSSSSNTNNANVNNFNPGNLYLYLFLIFIAIFAVGLLVIIFFIFYLISMNKKMNLLILSKMEDSKRNILLDRMDYEIKDKDDFDLDAMENKKGKNNIDKKVKKKTSKENLESSNSSENSNDSKNSNNEILDSLKDIEKLNENKNNKAKKEKEKAENKSENREENFGKVEESKIYQKIQFEDIVKLPERLLFVLLKEYDLNVLAVAIFKTDEDFQNKILQSLTYQDKQLIVLEIEKLAEFDSVSAEAILAMRQKIVDDINELINQGKIDLNKFL